MPSREITFVVNVPTFRFENGIFFMDVDIEGVPILAATPNILLSAIGGAEGVFRKWMDEQGSVLLPSCKMCDKING